ncbi:uncharacterized protein A4U43_C04F30020 [Asparagus officinalis]|uniref:Uncharacterized protein n=1 Tax=Asparagus officinalis TaxID=4686 RepID=A0A5P1F6G9_ASPOF|nr:uncharacterized protein A4U43_C04F30020 [Asparagus officinalis]
MVKSSVEFDSKIYHEFEAPVDHHNQFSHDGTHDPEVAYTFDGNAPLFFKGSSQEMIETIRFVNNKTLQEIITDANFLVPHEDVSVKLHFLFKDSYPYALPSLASCAITITNSEDSVKICSLKHGRCFRQEGLYEVNIIGLCLDFVNEDTPVKEVAIVPNTFGNELTKTEAQYIEGDTRFPGGLDRWIPSSRSV